MKRIFALLVSMVMLFVLTACGADNPADSKPSVTTAPTTHAHSYSSEVTTPATCEKEGVQTFTCACGHAYTEEIAATGEHAWDSWNTEACALVNRAGTETRTCATCAATETREVTGGVLENSFYDPGLEHIFYWGFNQDGTPRAYALLQYAPYRYDKFAYKVNSTDTICETLSKSFVLNDGWEDEMRAEGKAMREAFGYDEAKDTFTFEGLSMGSVGYAEVLGYVHNGGNGYTVYYGFAEHGSEAKQIYKVGLEFYRTDRFDIMEWDLKGEENKYLSFEKVDSTPSDMIR